MRERRRAAGRRLQVVAALALTALAGCTAQRTAAPAASRSASAPFILTFWCGPPLAEFDDARAAEVAAGGFTVMGPPCTGGFDAARNLQMLDVAQRHGLHAWVADHRFDRAGVGSPDWPASLNAAVADYRHHPALGGYFVTDEPVAKDFAAVAAVVGALRAADPERLAYVNLLPDYIPPSGLGTPTYPDYVEQFITTVHPQLLSYDYYPFGTEKDRSTFFANLATMRAAALAHDLPFMLIVLAMPHGPYRDPTEAELAWQTHHALAYGARGISYYTYWTPPKDQWKSQYGLIEEGRPTLHYFQVARLNRELSALAGALSGFSSIAVADSADAIGVPFPIGPLDGVDGGQITVGLFGDAAGSLAALLVNRDYRYGATAQLRLHPGAPPPLQFDADTSTWLPSGTLAIPLAPGGARLLRWDAASTPRIALTRSGS
jgi:hypothetical protein